MKFRAETQIEQASRPIGYADRIVSLGSCFAEEIGSRFDQHLFTVRTNPLGTLFNPLSICDLIEMALRETRLPDGEFFLHQELWRHFLVHSSLASPDREHSVQLSNKSLAPLGPDLRSADHLLITLGTGWVYRHKATNRHVAHNHRLPLSDFEKELISVDQLVQALSRALDLLFSLNPKIHVQLTVSPVRHIRDGLHANNLSKSVLLLATRELGNAYQNVDYFPAYELLIDELRDYRFFDQDLAHPTPMAVEYIWQQFARSQLNGEAQETCAEISSIRSSLNHKPLHPNTNAHRQTLQAVAARIDALT